MISSLLKKRAIAIITALSTPANPSPSQTAVVINGSFNASHRAISEKLNINGEAKLGVGTQVQDTITINGTLHANGTTFQSELVANGSSTLHQCSAQDAAYFSGTVTVTDSQFLADLKLRTHKSNFSNCKLNTMTVQKIPYIKKQVIYLQKGSVMKGDVTFESGHGEIVIDDSSQINGTIHGGVKITR